MFDWFKYPWPCKKRLPPPPMVIKAPPAVAPKGYAFYVERPSFHRYSSRSLNYTACVYLMPEDAAEKFKKAIEKGEPKVFEGLDYQHAQWDDNNEERTRERINDVMHTILRRKEAREKATDMKERLTGFYPPKEI